VVILKRLLRHVRFKRFIRVGEFGERERHFGPPSGGAG
jgi:hypothetical protein